MFANPFTPVFGGKPGFFFGRQALVERFERALEVRGSEDRALFVTGTRGSGKTSLVEHFSQQAQEAGWDVFDVNAENALNSLFRRLARFDTRSSTVAPQVGVTVLGVGGSVGGTGTTKTAHYTPEDLDTLLLETCERASKGVFISIDEIQKVPLEEVSRICGAFQMASRKGFDVALVVAGLPYAYDDVIHRDGCTYMRRCVHEELGLLSREEVEGAFASAFGSIKGLKVEPAALEQLVRRSSGHPYMMQLLGYHAVEFANQRLSGRTYRLAVDDVETFFPVALEAYERRSLQPLLDAMSTGAAEYLRAMVAVMDENHVAQTGDVAKEMGKTHSQVAVYRKELLSNGIILAPVRGAVRFNIPYLRDYLCKERPADENARLVEAWDV